MEDVTETNTQGREPIFSNTNLRPLPEAIRTHPNPTLEEVLAQQQALIHQQPSSRHHPPQILPRPINKDHPAPEERSRSKPAAQKVTKSTMESKSKEHQNKCPLPGTIAAKFRTIEASLTRCTTQDKRLMLLAKKGLTMEQYEELKAQRATEAAAKKPRSKAKAKAAANGTIARATRSSTTSTPSAHTRHRHTGLQTEDLSPLREFLGSLWGQGGRQWIEDQYLWPQLVLQAKQINQYYSGPRGAHLFCIMARFQNVEEKYEVSQDWDYVCCSAIRHPNLNGNEALRLTASILSTIQHNAGAVRCDLQSGHKLFAETHTWPHFAILETILKSSSFSISTDEPQLFSGQNVAFRSVGTFSLLT